MFRMFTRCALFLCASTLFISSSMADTTLPAPQQKGGEGIFNVLKNRNSFKREDMPKKQLSSQELSTLLWSATGQNRPEKGWTVPMAMGSVPYNQIYVLNESGTFLYDWKKNALVEISKEDVRSQVGIQSFVEKSPTIMVFVANGDALDRLNSVHAKNSAWVAAGAMTQNVYLAAASMDIGVRYIASIKPEAIQTKLKLKDNDFTMGLLLVGKK